MVKVKRCENSKEWLVILTVLLVIISLSLMGFASYIAIIKKKRNNKKWESREYEVTAKATGTIGALLFLISFLCVYSVYSYYYPKGSKDSLSNDLLDRITALGDAPSHTP